MRTQKIGVTPRGQTGGKNSALCPALPNRKYPWGKDPNGKRPAFPLHCGDTQKVIALHFSPAIPHPSPKVGGQWLQMTCALHAIAISLYV